MKKLLTAATAALIVGSGVLVLAQSGTAPAMQDHQKMDMSAQCKQMMAEHQKHKATMKAVDADLSRMVNRMDAANGNAKGVATSAIVKKLVAHQAMMHTMGDAMQMKMMSHMSSHMKDGKSMMECPMMQPKMKM